MPADLDDDGIDVAVDHEPGAQRAVVRVTGEVDTASVGELSAALEGLVANGATELHLDLGEVAFMDSTGLTALISARTLLEGKGTVVVESASSAVRRTFAVAGLDVVFGTA